MIPPFPVLPSEPSPASPVSLGMRFWHGDRWTVGMSFVSHPVKQHEVSEGEPSPHVGHPAGIEGGGGLVLPCLLIVLVHFSKARGAGPGIGDLSLAFEGNRPALSGIPSAENAPVSPNGGGIGGGRSASSLRPRRG